MNNYIHVTTSLNKACFLSFQFLNMKHKCTFHIEVCCTLVQSDPKYWPEKTCFITFSALHYAGHYKHEHMAVNSERLEVDSSCLKWAAMDTVKYSVMTVMTIDSWIWWTIWVNMDNSFKGWTKLMTQNTWISGELNWWKWTTVE